jgi:enolase
MKITSVAAWEILDSRGNPTVETTITLENGLEATAAVPSGASTGSREALELRDEDAGRFGGKGVLNAVAKVNEVIAPEIVGLEVEDQGGIDHKMLTMDGTEMKSNLGANAILSVSMAATRAAALANQMPLYAYVAQLFGRPTDSYLMPIPMMNVLNGGKHALKSTDMQEFMIMPVGAPSIQEAVRWGSEVFQTLGKILKKMGQATTVGDEGGYAPSLPTNQTPLELIVQAIEACGYVPGKDIAIALDPASTEFFEDGLYNLATENRKLTSDEMVELYKEWVDKFPIVSLEDGLAEEDWDGFVKLTEALGNRVQIVGDDLFVTNPQWVRKGIEMGAANSVLVKVNQIGTITETMETINLAREAGMSAVVSHRSGETEDTFIADFVVGAGTGQIKTGSLSRSERVAKYNRLMRIERELGERARMAEFPIK